MSDRRDPDVHRLVMDWPDDAIAEIQRLQDDNNRLVASVDKWSRFSERHGWLDPEDFDNWIATMNQRVAETEAQHNDELEAIRARDACSVFPPSQTAVADRRALLTEVNRLLDWQRRMVATVTNTRLSRDEWYAAVAALIEEAGRE